MSNRSEQQDKIIAALKEFGTLNIQDIARKTGMSACTVRGRIPDLAGMNLISEVKENRRRLISLTNRKSVSDLYEIINQAFGVAHA